MTVDESLSLIDEIDRLHRELILRASASSWLDFGKLMSKRDALVMKISGARKRSVLESVLRCNSSILQSAQSDRDAAGQRLHALRKEHNVRDFYSQNSGV